MALMCRYSGGQDETFVQSQIESAKAGVEKVLKEFSIEKYKILVFPQRSSEPDALSRDENIESFQGTGFTPEGPGGGEENLPPGYFDKESSQSDYFHRKSHIKYSGKNISRRYLDYLSVVVFIDDPIPRQAPVLKETIANYVLNRRRGDVLKVIFRKAGTK